MNKKQIWILCLLAALLLAIGCAAASANSLVHFTQPADGTYLKPGTVELWWTYTNPGGSFAEMTQKLFPTLLQVYRDGTLTDTIVFQPKAGMTVVFTAEGAHYTDLSLSQGGTYQLKASCPGSSGEYDTITLYVQNPKLVVDLDQAHFPDATFREYVRDNYDLDGNGSLDDFEIREITKLDIYGPNMDQKLTTLQGIEYLTSLKELYCASNSFTSLDLSKNTALEIVHCEYNQMTSLNMSNMPNLKEFWCFKNQLTSLTVENNPKLTDLSVFGNPLKTVDLTTLTALTYLDICETPQLTSLDLSRNTKLNEIWLFNSHLRYLDLQKCPVLVKLLREVDVRDFTGYDAKNAMYWRDDSQKVPGFFVCDRTLGIRLSSTETIGTVPSPTPTPTATPTPAPTTKAPAASTTQVTVKGAVYQLNSKTKTATLKKLENKKLSALTIPVSVKADGKTYTVTAVAANACKGAAALTKVSIGKKVTTIGNNAFYGAKKLKTVTGGAGVTAIGNGAFATCIKLAKLPAFPGLKTIGTSAFKGCKALTSVTLGTKVNKIGKNVFSGCTALKTVNVKTAKLTAKNVTAAAFKGIAKKVTFICPKKQLPLYKKLFVKKGAPKTAAFK